MQPAKAALSLLEVFAFEALLVSKLWCLMSGVEIDRNYSRPLMVLCKMQQT